MTQKYNKDELIRFNDMVQKFSLVLAGGVLTCEVDTAADWIVSKAETLAAEVIEREKARVSE